MKPWRASLATKALVLSATSLLAVAVVSGAFRYAWIRADLYGDVETSAENLLYVFEDLVRERPSLLAPAEIDPVVDRLVRERPAVSRLSLVNPAFIVVADTRLAPGSPSDQPALRPLLEQPGEVRSYSAAGGQPYFRLSRTLRGPSDPARHGDIVGAVSIDMRLAAVEARLRAEIRREVLLVFGRLLLIGALLYWLVRRQFVVPLQQLARAGARFAAGESPPPLEMPTGDEVEVLARAFNQMVTSRNEAAKQLEQALAASEDETRAMVNSAPDGIITIDGRGTVLTFNPASERMFGYEAAKGVGRSVGMPTPPAG